MKYDGREIINGLIDQLTLEDIEYLEPELNEPYLENLVKKLCKRDGHEVIADQCNKPEHDYCIYCRELIPGGAKRGS